ncbi:C39 family peptidase, partial [Brevibacillus sp. MCWH]|uniref:C39 family peptidase n=1 Tax=Brevibacillus sp. MCWH TaxID=2508871 RepID=UPI001491E4C1
AVYYSQDDPRWANKDFTSTNSKGKKSKFKKAGCGPTSAAMIVSSLTGRQVDPMQAYEFANRNGYTDPELGTRSDFFKDFASVHGVEINERKGKEGIIEQLKQRKMVILRGEGIGPFTKSGHYVVATGITKDGKILINDPLNKKRSKAYSPSVINKVTSHYVAKSPSMFDTQNKMFGFTEYGSGNIRIKDIYGNARITGDYGCRSDPFTVTRKMLCGIDLVYVYGTPINSFPMGTGVY